MCPTTRPLSSATSDKIALPFRRSASTRSASTARPNACSTTTRMAATSSGFSGRTVNIPSTSSEWLLVFPQLDFGYGLAVDFVGAVGQAQRALMSPGAGKVEILADAAAAVSLNRAVNNAQSHVRRDDLDHGDLGARHLVAGRIHHIRRFEREQPRLFYFYSRFGYIGADRSHFGERLAERDPMFGAAAHRFERAFGHSDRAHAMMDSTRPKASLRDLETAPFAQQDVRR